MTHAEIRERILADVKAAAPEIRTDSGHPAALAYVFADHAALLISALGQGRCIRCGNVGGGHGPGWCPDRRPRWLQIADEFAYLNRCDGG